MGRIGISITIRTRSIFFFLLLILTVSCFLFLTNRSMLLLHSKSYSKPNRMYEQVEVERVVRPKICILYHSPPDYFKQGEDVWNFSTCSYSNCRLTTRISEINDSKTVIFQHASMPLYPPKKKLDQIWMFTSSENPYNTFPTCKLPQWKNVFNWVMSYRRDSDFFFGYGQMIPRKEVKKDYEAIYKQKDKDIAWIVSHCRTDSQREVYVQQMKKIVNVDIFGKCGEKYCDIYKGNENDTCHDVVGRKYKFYLSFENAICKDYTTEKLFFAFALEQNVVPVVRGAYNRKEYLPSDAMIHADDFKSPIHLARYLREVGSDKNRYIEFLRRKDRYSSKPSGETFQDAMCSLCERLNSPSMQQPRTFDLVKWFWHNTCKKPDDIDWSRHAGDNAVKNISLVKNYLSNFVTF